MDEAPILVVAAVEEEIQGLAAALDNPADRHFGPWLAREGRLGKRPVRLLATGPGMANAVCKATAAMAAALPAMVIQTGCGGTYEGAGLDLGDIAVATEEIDVQTGIEPSDGGHIPDPFPFPLVRVGDLAVRRRYPVDAGLSAAAKKAIAARCPDLAVAAGPFATVATVSATGRRASRLARRFSVCLENMEGAGTAHVAMLYHIPFVEIRSVSNRAGTRQGWNLSQAFERCATATKRFIESLENGA